MQLNSLMTLLCSYIDEHSLLNELTTCVRTTN